jgi:hypothetical protein
MLSGRLSFFALTAVGFSWLIFRRVRPVMGGSAAPTRVILFRFLDGVFLVDVEIFENRLWVVGSCFRIDLFPGQREQNRS